ncbi:hypothetical protein ACWT_4202 [Actinoplanes sp. SE50]|nr:hypothetical protein ACPL_4331 [Actinoplanes sp. SE50/110]ATO83617.1 hypothetical protein ACWT_4202 [Actinoplanes sp. SE50]SLM01025.1 hypothetical protein ACSP50_4258 [Actinoplanes sp. SE50/110]
MIDSMSYLRMVGFWPPAGFPDRPWLEHPDEDAFVRSARSVCELYSEAVAQAAIPARHSELRLFCRLDRSRADVVVTVYPEVREGFETAAAAIPPTVAALPATDRARLVLDVVHAAATRLAHDRGGNCDALARAYDHALAAGLRFRWTGPAKTSPDRRHTARPVFVLHDDGYGRVIIEARRRVDGQVVAASASALAFSTSAGFRRAARTLRWTDANTMEIKPWIGLLGEEQGVLRLDLTNPGSSGTAEPDESAAGTTDGSVTRPAITVLTPDDLGARVEVIGGGPMNGIPAGYETTLHALLEQLCTPPWQAWWAAGTQGVLEIRYDFAAAATAISIRHAHHRWRATIRRPASTLAQATDPAGLARDDVRSMLSAMRRRTGLGEHPSL